MERSRFKPEEQKTTAAQQQQARQSAEFASVEEMLRFDAQQVTPPEQLDQRVKLSLAAEPNPIKSWWKKLFS